MLFRVIQPIVGPVVARAGNILVVWLDSPSHTVGVFESAHIIREIRTADVQPALLRELLKEWIENGVIAPCAHPTRVRLDAPLPDSWPQQSSQP